MRISSRLWLVLAVLSLGRTNLHADDAALKAEVQGILTAGWQTADNAIHLAGKHLERAKELAPNDIRADRAWALVKLKTNSPAEAAQVLDQLIPKTANDLSLRQLQIWVHASLREFPQTTQGLVALSLRLPKTADTPATDADRAAAKFLGLMFGYLAGPISDHVQDDKLAAKEKIVADGLPPELRTIYSEARESVLTKFADLVNHPPPEPAAPAAPAPNEFSGASEAEQSAALSGNGAFDPNDPRIADAKKRFLADQAPLRKKLDQLAKDYNFLAQQAATLQAAIAQAEKTAKSKEAAANKEKNQTRRVQLNADAKKAEDTAKRQQLEFNRLRGEAEKLKREAAPIKQELNSLTQKYKAEAVRLTQATPAKPATTTKKPEPAPATPAPTPMPVLTVAQRREALSTYIPVSLDEEKDRLLATFAR